MAGNLDFLLLAQFKKILLALIHLHKLLSVSKELNSSVDRHVIVFELPRAVCLFADHPLKRS